MQFKYAASGLARSVFKLHLLLESAMHYQSNFFEFINRYRVEEAKRLLLSPEFKDETILEIIYKSGFNSPSAFHRFFKRMVDMTPTEFRQQGK